MPLKSINLLSSSDYPLWIYSFFAQIPGHHMYFSLYEHMGQCLHYVKTYSFKILINIKTALAAGKRG